MLQVDALMRPLSDRAADRVQCVSVQNVDRETWTSIVQGFADYSYEQSYDYTRLRATRGEASPLFLTVHAGDRLIGAASARLKTFPLIGRGLVYISNGPLMQTQKGDWDTTQNQAVLEALKRKITDEDGNFLCVRLPASPPAPKPQACAIFAKLGFRATGRVRSYHTIIKDLKLNEGELRSSLSKKWRGQLNYAQRAGLAIEHGSTMDIFMRFLKLYGQMREVKDFPGGLDPQLLFDLPTESLGLQVLMATKDGQDAAGHVLSLLGDTAVVLLSATNELGRATRAGYLVFWSAMELARSRGLGWYDLGGVDARYNPGVYRFKCGMGGHELAAIGPYEAWPTGRLPTLLNMLLTLRTHLGMSRV